MSAATEPQARPRIDKDALRKKYLEERDKRLRPEGNEQYVEIKGQLAHYLEDPYTPRTERAPNADSRRAKTKSVQLFRLPMFIATQLKCHE